MRDWLSRLFYGRQGMDELSKALFWGGIGGFALAVLISGLGLPGLGGIFLWFAMLALVLAFVRAFSRNLRQREGENMLFLRWLDRQKKKLEDAKERRKQSKDYKFFKCPGCGKWLRVPRHKGKIHINCKCGYTLYRKT